MAIAWKTYLDDVQYEEPINMADLEISIVRDDSLHGIGFEASTIPLVFVGAAADYIEGIKDAQGLKGNITFRATQNCGDEEEFETVIEGKINLGQYKRSCGDICQVKVPIESTSCETVLKNRYDQNVDLDKAIAFDGITGLPGYHNLGLDMTLPAKAIKLIDNATLSRQVTEVISDQVGWAPNITGSGFQGYITPAYDTTAYSAFGSFNPGSFLELFPGSFEHNPDPVLNFQPVTVNAEEILGSIKCGLANTVVKFRFKGSATTVDDGLSALFLKYKVFRYLKGTDPFLGTSWIELYSNTFADLNNNRTVDFDFSATVPVPGFEQGDWIVVSIYASIFSAFFSFHSFSITQDVESFLDIETESLCQDSTTKAYLVHETLSRVTEAITNYCVRVKSSYYGRVDSEPFDFPDDGCGGLRFVTSGLKIRNAVNPTFFTSLKSLIEGLQAIDNIGMGVEIDPDRPNYFLLRVEALDYFYQDKEIFRCEAISTGEDDMDETKSYSVINVGYKKWEITNTNGLDEFNSTREYRTALTSISTALDITSGLVAGGYPIEITREQSFAETGAADTTYDNETFIICLKRITATGYPYGEMVVEQGNIQNPENIFSPGTALNYRISPIRNLMRWFRSIASSYANIIDTDNRLSFNAGTGNLLAKGFLNEVYGIPTCELENMSISESQDLAFLLFKNLVDATPLWKNETFTYDYPMSLKDYKSIKAMPYGYISYQCGNGGWQKGWIKEIKYKQVAGMATITLKRKWS